MRTVLYDANVLYSSFLRDFLVRLARTAPVRAYRTEAIHEEWIRNLLANRPDLPRETVIRIRDLMNAALPDSLVTGYEHRIEALGLPDPGDRHVLAAAIEAGVDVILTFNLRDLPPEALEPHGIQAELPDTFVAAVYDHAPASVIAAAREHRAALRRPHFPAQEYLDRLRANGLGSLADRFEADGIEL